MHMHKTRATGLDWELKRDETQEAAIMRMQSQISSKISFISFGMEARWEYDCYTLLDWATHSGEVYACYDPSSHRWFVASDLDTHMTALLPKEVLNATPLPARHIRTVSKVGYVTMIAAVMTGELPDLEPTEGAR